MPPRQGTGHINWDQFVNANRASATSLAQKLQDPIAQQGAQGQFLLDRSKGDYEWGVGNAEGEANLRGGDYAGPRSLADIPDYATGLEAAEKAAKGSRQLADIYGRAGMLGEQFGSTAGYGAGARTFDSALLGSVGQGGFEATRNQYGSGGDAYRSALEASRPLATSAAGRVRDRNAAKDWGGFLGNDQKAVPIAAPAPPPNPYVQSAKDIEEENRRMIRMRGGKG
jgi:hypothetical protein